MLGYLSRRGQLWHRKREICRYRTLGNLPVHFTSRYYRYIYLCSKRLQYCGPSGSGTGHDLSDPALKQNQVNLFKKYFIYYTVFNSVTDPVPFCHLDPGSGSGMNIPGLIFCVKILKFFDADPGSCQSWIRDGKNRIRDKHLGSGTLVFSKVHTHIAVQQSL
jgi:hypothetical protein